MKIVWVVIFEFNIMVALLEYILQNNLKANT